MTKEMQQKLLEKFNNRLSFDHKPFIPNDTPPEQGKSIEVTPITIKYYTSNSLSSEELERRKQKIYHYIKLQFPTERVSTELEISPVTDTTSYLDEIDANKGLTRLLTTNYQLIRKSI